MKKSDIIRKRRSVRTFDGKALPLAQADRILEFAESAANPYGIPIEWKLLDAERDGLRSPVIVGTNLWIAGKAKRVRHAAEAFGYSFEKAVLFAEEMGVGTTWIAGTMNRSAFENAMAVAADEVLPCVSPLGYPAKKMSFRELMMRKGIKANTRKEFEEICFDGDFNTPLSPKKAGKLRLPLEMVRLAPSAVNRQPWRIVVQGDRVHFYQKSDKRFVAADGWDIQRIDMGIALCHFALGAEEEGLSVIFLQEDPALAVPEDVFYVASYALS